jgi:hypothetical protein
MSGLLKAVSSPFRSKGKKKPFEEDAGTVGSSSDAASNGGDDDRFSLSKLVITSEQLTPPRTPPRTIPAMTGGGNNDNNNSNAEMNNDETIKTMASAGTVGTFDDSASDGTGCNESDEDDDATPAAERPDGKTIRGETYRTQTKPAGEVDASLFNLRIGPNYSRTGAKAPSGPSIYKLAGVDLVRATGTVVDPAAYYDLQVPTTAAVSDLGVPMCFVVNCNLPTEAPSMFGGDTGDKPVINIVFHFVLSDSAVEAFKEAFKEASKNGPPVAEPLVAEPHLRLLKQWCSVAPNDRQFMGRFKAMCVVDEIEKLGLPSFINKFNGKPVLINKSGSIVRYDAKMAPIQPNDKTTPCAVLVQNVNVGVFSFVARKGLFSLMDSFNTMILNVAFTIQGNSDDELPEVVLGCARLDCMDSSKVPVREV